MKAALGRARNLWQLCLSSRTISQRTFPPRIITISTYRVELNGCTIAFALKSISSASKGPLKMEQQSGSSDGSPQWGAPASLFCPGGRARYEISFIPTAKAFTSSPYFTSLAQLGPSSLPRFKNTNRESVHLLASGFFQGGHYVLRRGKLSCHGSTL